MKIETVNGVTDIKMRVFKPVSGIIVTKDGNIADEKIEITRVNGARGEVETICPRMELKEHFEISAHGEGLYLDKDGGSRGLIGVGMGGAASLSSDRYLDLEFSSLEAGSTYVIYGLEEGEIVERTVVYHPIVINSDEELREFGLKDQEFAAFPFTGLVKVELFMTNGQTVTYTPEELKVKMENENDICCFEDDGAIETIHYGYRDMALVDITGAQSIKVHKSAGNAYQLIFIDQQ